MSRVTSAEHYRRHQFIRMLFSETGLQILFTLLSLPKQYELHDYYAMDQDLDEPAFAAHRKAKGDVYPSLANRAGKSYRVVQRAFVEASRAQGFTKQQMSRAIAVHHTRHGRGGTVRKVTVSVLPVAKPLDHRRLAQTLLALARYQDHQATSSSSSDPSQTSSRAG